MIHKSEMQRKMFSLVYTLVCSCITPYST